MGRNGAKKIPMTDLEKEFYERLYRRKQLAHVEHQRVQILLSCHSGLNNVEVSKQLNVSISMVKKWRSRWLSGYEGGLELEGQEKEDYLIKFLKDNQRSGAPKRISVSEEKSIIALACGKPRSHGIEMTDWTLAMLCKASVSKGIVKSISTSQMSRLLKNTDSTTA